MKKKIIITFLFILGLILVNSISFYNFFNNFLGKDLYYSGKYLEAYSDFEKAGNILGKYNKANSLYKEKKYDEALKIYKEIVKNNKDKINFYINHNTGNTYYRIGETEKDLDKKIKDWEDSISNYKIALNLEFNEETKKNKEFVEKKLEELKKQKTSPQPSPTGDGEDQEKSGSGSEQNTGTGSQEQKTGTGQQDTGSGTKDKKQGQNQKGFGKNEDKDLTKEQQQEIEKYEQSLKDIQTNNQDSFNKVYNEYNNSNDILDVFKNDPFFNNNLLDDNSGKKDW